MPSTVDQAHRLHIAYSHTGDSTWCISATVAVGINAPEPAATHSRLATRR